MSLRKGWRCAKLQGLSVLPYLLPKIVICKIRKGFLCISRPLSTLNFFPENHAKIFLQKFSANAAVFSKIIYMWRILRFDELDSTNAYAKRICSLIADKTTIVARIQTAGRGRMDRKWLSQPGGLYFSVVLKPQQTDFLPNLTQLMALSVCCAVQEIGATAWLKWPNDVLVDGKKLCGILSEAVTGKNGLTALVLGVGINVNQTDLHAAGQPAVSLRMLGIQIDTDSLLQRVLDNFFAVYPTVLEQGFQAIRSPYLQHFPYIGKQVTIRHGASPVSGIVETISPDGKLILNTPQGQTIISIGDMCV